jgi:hypothetical protein
VLISNVGMIEEYAMLHAHILVVLSQSNQRMKGCVDLQCGHECATSRAHNLVVLRIESMKEGM